MFSVYGSPVVGSTLTCSSSLAIRPELLTVVVDAAEPISFEWSSLPSSLEGWSDTSRPLDQPVSLSLSLSLNMGEFSEPGVSQLMVPGVATVVCRCHRWTIGEAAKGIALVVDHARAALLVVVTLVMVSISLGESVGPLGSRVIWVESSAPRSLCWSSSPSVSLPLSANKGSFSAPGLSQLMVPGVATGLVSLSESVSLGESAKVPVSQAIWVESSAPGSLVSVELSESVSPGESVRLLSSQAIWVEIWAPGSLVSVELSESVSVPLSANKGSFSAPGLSQLIVPGVVTGLVSSSESVSLGESARVPVPQAIWVESSAPGSLCRSSCRSRCRCRCQRTRVVTLGSGVEPVAGRVGETVVVPGDLGGELGPGVARVGRAVGVGVVFFFFFFFFFFF